jgi:NADH:ubiquinone oxidoreductase subunit 2 (subunit N)
LIFYLFLAFYIFDIRYVRSLNELKNCGNLIFVSFFIICIILSLSGIPPFLGFIGKLLLFVFLMSFNNFFYLLFFILLNFFIIFFYLQNIKLLVSTAQTIYLYFYKHKIYLNELLVYSLTIGFIINLNSLLFILDFFFLYYYY